LVIALRFEKQAGLATILHLQEGAGLDETRTFLVEKSPGKEKVYRDITQGRLARLIKSTLT
jgi:hypothetical protein